MNILTRIYHKFFLYDLNKAYRRSYFEDNLIDSFPIASTLSKELISLLNLSSVVDLGCATGHWVGQFNLHGVDCIGFEGSKNTLHDLKCDHNKHFIHDLRKPLPKKFKKKVDLVMSFEVAEHIEKRKVKNYVKNFIFFEPNHILLTAAPPGQGGDWHINLQKKPYWLSLFNDVGYENDIDTFNKVSKIIDNLRNLNQNLIQSHMKNPKINHQGVWIPTWMPANLICLKKTPF